MIDRALASGMEASYVLMDSWFTFAPLIGEITKCGLDVIGMVKSTNQRYLVNARKLSLKELYSVATPVQGKHKGVLRTIRTQMVPGIPMNILFVRHRTNKNEWLAILCTDLTLTEEEIIRIYSMRWDIETFSIILSTKVAERVGRIKERYPSMAQYYDIVLELDEEQKKVVSISLNKKPSREKRATLTGCYVIETSHRDLDAQEIWRLYTTLVKVEEAFRDLKTDLGFRPVHH